MSSTATKIANSRVERAMEQTNYNTKRARELLIDWSARDVELRQALVILGAQQAIRDFYHTERRHALDGDKSTGHNVTVPTPEMLERKERKMERRLFWDRWALYGHKPLRLATKGDLVESVSSRHKMAAGLTAAAEFEATIAKKMIDEKKQVCQCFSVDQLIKIARRHNVA